MDDSITSIPEPAKYQYWSSLLGCHLPWQSVPYLLTIYYHIHIQGRLQETCSVWMGCYQYMAEQCQVKNCLTALVVIWIGIGLKTANMYMMRFYISLHGFINYAKQWSMVLWAKRYILCKYEASAIYKTSSCTYWQSSCLFLIKLYVLNGAQVTGWYETYHKDWSYNPRNLNAIGALIAHTATPAGSRG